VSIRPWEVTATPRGVECVKCGRPSEYLHDGTSPVCSPCAIIADKGPHMYQTVRVAPPTRERALIVYAESVEAAHYIAQEAGYTVHKVGAYVPITSKVVDSRRAPGA
jgi:hypothetical protein